MEVVAATPPKYENKEKARCFYDEAFFLYAATVMRDGHAKSQPALRRMHAWTSRLRVPMN